MNNIYLKILYKIHLYPTKIKFSPMRERFDVSMSFWPIDPPGIVILIMWHSFHVRFVRHEWARIRIPKATRHTNNIIHDRREFIITTISRAFREYCSLPNGCTLILSLNRNLDALGLFLWPLPRRSNYAHAHGSQIVSCTACPTFIIH